MGTAFFLTGSKLPNSTNPTCTFYIFLVLPASYENPISFRGICNIVIVVSKGTKDTWDFITVLLIYKRAQLGKILIFMLSFTFLCRFMYHFYAPGPIVPITVAGKSSWDRLSFSFPLLPPPFLLVRINGKVSERKWRGQRTVTDS